MRPFEDVTADLPRFIDEVYNTKRLHFALGYHRSVDVKATRRTNVAASQRPEICQRFGLCLFSPLELADLAKLPRTYVGSVERSERNISIDNIERLAVALEVTVPDLLSATLVMPATGR